MAKKDRFFDELPRRDRGNAVVTYASKNIAKENSRETVPVGPAVTASCAAAVSAAAAAAAAAAASSSCTAVLLRPRHSDDRNCPGARVSVPLPA